MGGVDGVSTTMNFGRNEDPKVSSRGLPRITLVVGLGILYLIVLLKLTCICFTYIHIMILKHWWFLVSPWLGGAKESLG